MLLDLICRPRFVIWLLGFACLLLVIASFLFLFFLISMFKVDFFEKDIQLGVRYMLEFRSS